MTHNLSKSGKRSCERIKIPFWKSHEAREIHFLIMLIRTKTSLPFFTQVSWFWIVVSPFILDTMIFIFFSFENRRSLAL